MTKNYISGFPRIGENRELKFAVEGFWKNSKTKEQLVEVAAQLRKKNWQLQKDRGVDFISSNDFSFYDSMLDTIEMLGAIPQRFQNIADPLERYFAMARGSDHAQAMAMTKWFNTNYHYIVPELQLEIEFRLNAQKILSEYQEAKDMGIQTKINLIGPITFLALSKIEGDFLKWFHKVLPVYKELLQEISKLDKEVFVQMDEPIFVKDPQSQWLEVLETCYTQLSQVASSINIIVATYFEHSNEANRILANVNIWGLALDFVHGEKNLETISQLKNKKLIAGVVDGRNIWKNDLGKSLQLLEKISTQVDKSQIIVSTSNSLLHVPYTIANEPDSDIKKWLAFAYEKMDEVVLLSKLFRQGQRLYNEDIALLENKKIMQEKASSHLLHDEEVQQKIKTITKKEREKSFEERMAVQKEKLLLPPLPTTTIGSFPQTSSLRKIRKDYKAQKVSVAEYEDFLKKYIDDCIAVQEEIGLDVLVHGEPERNDMVEYFGEMLNGFHFTKKAWVQSYGSRCVKPPIIFADISRNQNMTSKWIVYAQSKTQKPMKGMLTGPVTILNWSFVRNDKERWQVAEQIAVALRDEINDLQNSEIKIIQVDEAAFKEGYPLRKENIEAYEKWAVACFKLAVSEAKPQTQIHTHMCYSDFNNIMHTIQEMDADVISIETARSGNQLLYAFEDAQYHNEIGVGVYDIHSPRVPSVQEFEKQIAQRLQVLDKKQAWVNPDCGLKTRNWEEVKPALQNMVAATKSLRKQLS